MTRSSTKAALIVAAVGAAAVASVVGLALGSSWLAFVGLGAAIIGAAGFAFHLIVTERRRHEVVEEELVDKSSFLEALIESMGSITATHEPQQVLERTRREAKELFGANASLLAPGQTVTSAPAENAVLLPLRIRGEEIGALRLVRSRPLDREELARARLLADFASRAVENTRLLAEAQVREAERARLSDQLITAEQEERRRLALFLHDGPVQSLAGISLMLDAAIESIGGNRLEEATRVTQSALERHRDTIRSLRDLSFNIEPVVLRDQGFAPAMEAFAEQVGLANRIQVDLDVDAADAGLDPGRRARRRQRRDGDRRRRGRRAAAGELRRGGRAGADAERTPRRRGGRRRRHRRPRGAPALRGARLRRRLRCRCQEARALPALPSELTGRANRTSSDR